MAELSLISTSSSGNESGRFSSNGRDLQIHHDLEEDSAPIGIDDEIADDVVAEDYAPDPRDYYSHFYRERAAAVITEPKYRDWADEHTRLRSYRGWPAQLRQTPRDLAAAGLLYMGQGDRCKCYWCGGELYDWDPEDLPWVEHAKWFQQCGFVRQQMGEQFVINVKNGVTTNIESPSNQEFLRRPHVLAALNDYRYTREQVLEALHTYGVLNLVTAQDIRKYVEELTRKRQVALMHAGLSDNVTYANLRQSSHLVKGSDSSFAVSAGGQQVAQPSDEAGASNGQLCIEDLAMEGVEESNSDSINYRRLQNLSLNAHSSSLSSASIPSDVDDVLKENEKLKEQRVCKVCMDREVCVTFLPCRHLATCEECAESISTCPICRSDVESKVKIYWA
ncbi:hypothetical protein DPMN_046197 [Dreissena polymorpha]|uniref:RING-type domain-containing protein n=1 Tax=Dreissena polymorpha TaxID=45954 RepID=A0A9D4D5R6_DREPO|nr:hypothetical protein DPMN_046197 [Dreissena polymorpha]